MNDPEPGLRLLKGRSQPTGCHLNRPDTVLFLPGFKFCIIVKRCGFYEPTRLCQLFNYLFLLIQSLQPHYWFLSVMFIVLFCESTSIHLYNIVAILKSGSFGRNHCDIWFVHIAQPEAPLLSARFQSLCSFTKLGDDCAVSKSVPHLIHILFPFSMVTAAETSTAVYVGVM